MVTMSVVSGLERGIFGGRHQRRLILQLRVIYIQADPTPDVVIVTSEAESRRNCRSRQTSRKVQTEL